ncbi:MAG: hypothetical protein OXN44_13695 [Acidimicrobiaceae bacterium]|nr:hypothetical protein [Acidimicrobiaceae bacterium]MDE0606931.1 hypothetical protein [Acidimicrobiaceae bacterium]
MSEDSNNSTRKRSRSRNRNKGNPANSNPVRQNAQSRGRKATAKVDPIEFWGDPELLPEPEEVVAQSGDARALLNSLGRPPVPGQETAAEQWFTLVYERAAFLAGALAAAGELDQSE